MKQIETINSKYVIRVLAYSIPICIIILALMYYWFAIEDRNSIFLYYHDMGAKVPDTSPFSFVTSSRYWMSGLVANGFVFLLYSFFTFIRLQFKGGFSQPDKLHVLYICAPILIVGTLIITMTMNEPVLPFNHALKVALANLIGLMIALYTAQITSKNFLHNVFQVIDGFAIGLMMNASTWLENIDTMPAWRVMVLLKIYMICFILIIITSVGYIKTRKSQKVHALFLYCLAIGYLFGSLFHYLFGTDGHYYITNSDNFFTRNIAVQFIIWIFIFLLSYMIVKFRNGQIKNRRTKEDKILNAL